MDTVTQPVRPTRRDSAAAIGVIDCDIHNSERSWAEIRDRLPRFFQDTGFPEPGRAIAGNPNGLHRDDAVPEEGGPPGSSLALMQSQHLDPNHITHAILTGAGPMGVGVHANADYAAAVIRAANDNMIETWLAAGDDRLWGSVIAAPNNPEASAKEIRRVGGHPRMVQVLMTSATRTPLGDRFHWPIYEAAVEMGLPVAVHPGNESTGIANTFSCGFPDSYFEWHTNLSQNYMGQLTSLVCRGVFQQFPTLRFVCIEGGFAWVPHLMWRLDKNWKGLRVTTPWLDRLPSEVIVEHVRFTTQPIEEPSKPEHLLQILEMMHADRTLIFSSDYPHWDGDDPMHAFPRMPEALQRRILRDTALELYNFSKPGNGSANGQPVQGAPR